MWCVDEVPLPWKPIPRRSLSDYSAKIKHPDATPDETPD